MQDAIRAVAPKDGRAKRQRVLIVKDVDPIAAATRTLIDHLKWPQLRPRRSVER